VTASLGVVDTNKRYSQKLGYKFKGAMTPDYVSASPASSTCC